jgi:hypothetical protein
MRDQTYREIAEALTDRGITTPRGGDTWNQVTVMRAMKRLGIRGSQVIGGYREGKNGAEACLNL